MIAKLMNRGLIVWWYSGIEVGWLGVGACFLGLLPLYLVISASRSLFNIVAVLSSAVVHDRFVGWGLLSQLLVVGCVALAVVEIGGLMGGSGGRVASRSALATLLSVVGVVWGCGVMGICGSTLQSCVRGFVFFPCVPT